MTDQLNAAITKVLGGATLGEVIANFPKKVQQNVIDYLAAPANVVALKNDVREYQQKNAIEHSHTSARIALVFGDANAEKLGNFKEEMGGDLGSLDSWKDQWNNEVGRKIAEYMKKNNLPYSALDDLIMDAFKNGELIKTNIFENDPRFPMDQEGNFNPNVPPSPTWNTPSNSWPGSSAGDMPDKSPVPGFIPPPGPNGGSGGGSGGWWDDLTGPFRRFFDFPPVSPLIIDFDKDGLIELTPLTDVTGSFFDLDADGFVEQTGWVKADDALLARDVNGNGVIDNISELFGNATTDGFIVLDALDSNNDNIISSADAAFASLLVWRDLDGDAYSDAGELQSTCGLTASARQRKSPVQRSA